jgi:hypothetical protein
MWVAWKKGSRVRPVLWIVGAFGTDGVLENVVTGVRECVSGSFLAGEHVIMRLRLETDGFDGAGEMGSEEARGVQLVGVRLRAQEDEMDVIGHYDVCGTEEGFTDAGVENEFADGEMEFFRELEFTPVECSVGPENKSVGLVIGFVEARE